MMKAKIIMVTFFILMSLTGCNTSNLNSKNITSTSISNDKILCTEGTTTENTIPSFESVTWKNLTNDPYILVIYLNDDESNWNETSMNKFWNDNIEPGLSHLRKEAEDNGHTLTLTAGSYYAPLKYNGSVVGDSSNETVSRDILDQTALSLGYTTKEELHHALQIHTGNPEISYVVLLNKPGNSYSLTSSTLQEAECMEHCVVFNTYL